MLCTCEESSFDYYYYTKLPHALGKIYTLMFIVGTFRKNIRKRGQVK